MIKVWEWALSPAPGNYAYAHSLTYLPTYTEKEIIGNVNHTAAPAAVRPLAVITAAARCH